MRYIEGCGETILCSSHNVLTLNFRMPAASPHTKPSTQRRPDEIKMHMAQHDPRDEDLMIHVVTAGNVPLPVQDPLDDVFGSDGGSPVFGSEHAEVQEAHPSDVRRLQTEHTTAGYREGISVAKAKSIQAGFDEGFSLGATIGLKAGQVLGLLEGVAGALRAGNSEDYSKAQQLLEDARKDLSTGEIYGEKYWAPDGTWKFELQHAASKVDVIFEDVANAHPLISKWNILINEQMRNWGIDLLILQQTHETSSAMVTEKKEIKIEQQVREQLEW
jgi:hypothetical protein